MAASKVPISDEKAPASHAEAITPSDTEELSYITRGIYVGVGGDIVVVMPAGSTIAFKNAVAGTVLPISVRQVKATNTTATNLVALH